MVALLSTELSHQHSLETLEVLSRYPDFLRRLGTVCDMGCNIGLDSIWWATLTREDGTTPLDITVTAVDVTIDQKNIKRHKNINYVESNFTNINLPAQSQDFVWAHNSLQFSTDPFKTLNEWWRLMSMDAMLLVSIPYQFSVNNHRDISKPDVYHTYNSFFNWSLGNLIMTLAATGFDCREGHFKIDRQAGWIQAAVYKIPKKFNDTPNWYQMCEEKMLPVSIEQAIMKNGCFHETDIVCEWIDRSQYILAV